MRIALTLDKDVADRTRALATQCHKPFRALANEALRLGLESIERPAKQRTYRTCGQELGLRQGRNLDNIQALLAQIDGEDAR